MMVIVPPIRRYFGDGPREPIPLTYPSKPQQEPGAGSMEAGVAVLECRS